MNKEKIIKSIDCSIKELNAIKTELLKNDQSSMFDEIKGNKKSVIYSNEVHSVIHYLSVSMNNKKIAYTDKRLSMIKKMVDLSSVKDAKNVILTRIIEWSDNDEMKKYLTIETIFRPSNYHKYLEDVDRILSDLNSGRGGELSTFSNSNVKSAYDE